MQMNLFNDGSAGQPEFGNSLQNESWSTASLNHLRNRFYFQFKGNLLVRRLSLDIRMPSRRAFDFVISEFERNQFHPEYMWLDDARFVVMDNNAMVVVTNRNRHSRDLEDRINEFDFDIYGAQSNVDRLWQAIRDEFHNHSFTRIDWAYNDNHGIDTRTLYIQHDQTARDEYYPWFNHGVDQFVQDYLNSSATTLVLYGPPGTGKTSFLKHMITTRRLNCLVSYDEKVLRDDSFFIDFLTNPDYRLMVVEDADLLLTSREEGHNEIMSKFLNVGDGLIKVPDKKLIFTTNLTQLNRVDQALLRKGRCFAAVEFRRLRPEEAKAAAGTAGVPQADWYSQSDWSLAEIFNGEPSSVETAPKFKIGF